MRPYPNRRTALTLAGLGTAGALLSPGAAVAGIRPWTAARSPWVPLWTEDFTHNVARGTFRPNPAGRLVSAETAPYAERLIAYPDGWRATNGVGIYAPSRSVSVDSGALTIRCFTDATTGEPVSGAVGTTGSSTYGRWAWRMRGLTTSPGWNCVCLLWPVDDASWPRSGEIDWPESDLSEQVKGFYHPAGGRAPTEYVIDGTGSWADWNDYVLEWTPTSVRYGFNGRIVFSTSTNIPNQPMRWVVQTGEPPYKPAKRAPGATAMVQISNLSTWAYRG
ncbi:glycoside hydrolase family 16 protein [Flexivirga sp. ID2601S]|uniref:Glycoside hydrolase family 16 protein n=1 Tax=Flexivirga aerilata TaxID=1656889 RepID=A0A849AG57_9MICO|nr:glycoside hydrolase family 16 protein [Flexivirga aerilata]NNG38556.1 glycoside hydrolase family 16 protein [Flexivirga aerilata]